MCSSLQLFTDTFCKTFENRPPGRETAKAPFDLRQGKARITDYAIEFRTLAADSGWNDSSLFDAFIHGLSDQIKDQLTPLDLPPDIDSLIALCAKIDNRLWEREKERERRPARSPPRHQRSPTPCPHPVERRQPVPPSSTAALAEPMQLECTKLTPEERQRRLVEGRCFYCGQLGHCSLQCPVKGPAHQ